MNRSRILADTRHAALLVILLVHGAAHAGNRAAPPASPGFEPSELSTDCIDREYRGENRKLGLDYTDMINNCGKPVIVTWQSFDNGAPQAPGGGMGQSACIPPGGSFTTASHRTVGTDSENLPVSVVTCQ